MNYPEVYYKNSSLINNGIEVGRWATATEEEFREMAREVFKPKEKGE